MNDEHEFFELLAVKLLFKRIGEGRLILNNEQVPNLKRAIDSVKFLPDGEPVMGSVEPQVLSLALRIANEEVNQLESALNKTGDTMEVQELLPKETDVSDEMLRKCHSENDFTNLAFELFKEAAILTSIASCCYKTELPTKFPWQ